MTLTKLVDGVVMPLTAEETAEMQAYWAANAAAHAADLAANGYKYERMAALPPAMDLLQMLYNDMYGGKIAAAPSFCAAIKAVYDKYPAPVVPVTPVAAV
jgi:hypothetical protein